MEKAIAVVVSYNRQALLSECINALRNQTRKPDAILVVNNGSTDNTEQWLSQQPDVHFITQNNIGSGGGFNTGIEWGFKKGYTWIWCMDDDGYPKEDALELLLNVDMPNQSLLNCAVLNKEDKQSFVWNTNNYKNINEVKEDLIKGIGHPFNGTLIHRSIIEKVGAPKASLFLWGDETEYYYRITKQHAIPVYTVAKSVHYHPATAFSLKQDWDFKNSWKLYFYVRNRFHIHRAKFSNKLVALINYLFFIAAFAGVILFFQKTDKSKKLGFLLWPIADAFKNNFTATPSTILVGLNERKNKAYNFSLLLPFRNIWTSIMATGNNSMASKPASA
jgi:rhamnopyranosyl-N-acetylglucosaminyl-diphospho-decaprenol beta-1,3/1,4-galactofuranosyltransferase